VTNYHVTNLTRDIVVTYYLIMDLVFKALADETRRLLLDRLRQRDGQTLTELEASMGMTRFGVMKHLRVLEAASLVTTRRSGRFKYHYLNAAPLQSLVDRWIEPVTQQPMTRALLDLKTALEGAEAMPTPAELKPDFVLETFIRTTPEKLWEALISAEMCKHYHFASATIRGTFETGSSYDYLTPDGHVMLSGKILAADRPHRLDMTFIPGWLGPNAKPSRNVYEIKVVGNLTKLTVLHFDLPDGQDGVREGWAKIIASLKSFLETGEGLSFS
jgi:uncharacterized protein YndB with AHSA1/START domain/DNA-binding transcriptional ArsR family regulator